MAAAVGHCYRCAPVGPTDILEHMRSCLWATEDRLLGMHAAVSLLLTDDRIALLCYVCHAMLRPYWVSVECLFLGLRLQARYTQWEYPCRDLSPPQCECLCKDPCPGNGRQVVAQTLTYRQGVLAHH